MSDLRIEPIDYLVYQEPKPKGLEMTEKVVDFFLDHKDSLIHLALVVFGWVTCKTTTEFLLFLLLIEATFFFNAALKKLSFKVEIHNYRGSQEDSEEDDTP